MTSESKEPALVKDEVLKAIAAFEQIVEAMPGDVTSLEALCHAYEQLGHREKASDYLCKLAEALLSEGDVSSARALSDRLQAHADDSPDAKALLVRIESSTEDAAADQETGTHRVAEPVRPAEASMDFDMSEALAFAWRLREVAELSEEEYAKLAHDLTEMSVGEQVATTSVLHALESVGHKGLDRIMNFVAKDRGTPIISLSSFETRARVAGLLPLEFMTRRGVLVFELLGDDALVVTMNPYEESLRNDVETLTGKKCHFYISLASEFDLALDRGKAALAEREKAD